MAMNFDVVSDGRTGNAMKISPNAVPEASPYGKGVILQNIGNALEAGAIYRVTVYAKAVNVQAEGNTNESKLQVVVNNGYTPEGKKQSFKSTAAASKNFSDWTAHTLLFSASAPHNNGDSIEIGMSKITNADGYWLIDDVSIEKIASIVLDKTEVALEVGNSVALVATPNDNEQLLGETPALTWSSSDESVATVDTNGKVTAVSNGTANITVTAKTTDSKNSVSATSVVTVTAPTVVPLTGISISDSSAELAVGTEKQLTVIFAPENTTEKTISWSSTDTNIATVDENGKITALAKGSATITATGASNLTATCTVTVTERGNTIIINGGFEDTETMKVAAIPGSTTAIGITGWKYYVNNSTSVNAATMNFEIAENGGRNQAQAMKVYASEIAENGKGKGVVIQSQISMLEKDTTYLLTVHAKADLNMNDDSKVKAILYNGKTNVATTTAFQASAAKDDWYVITKEFTLNEAVSSSGVRIEIEADNIKTTEGYWLFDDISIVQVPTITIQPSVLKLETGDNTEIIATITDPHKVLGEVPDLSCISNNTDVATVIQENGKFSVKTMNEGTAAITVTAASSDGKNSISAECAVTVIPRRIISNGDFAEGTDKWTNGQGTDVAYTSVAEGRTDNALKVAPSDGITGAVAGIFEQILDTKVSDGLLVSGSKYLVTAYVKPVGANSDSKVTVSWFDSESATAQKAEIEAGTSTDWIPVTFEFTAGDMSAAGTSLKVQASNLTSGYWLFDDISIKRVPYVSLSQAEMDIVVGEREEIDATMIDPDYILDKTGAFDYSSADESIAKVDLRGRVTGVSAGTTTITVTNAYYPDYSATFTVNVSTIDLTAISLPATLNLCEAEQEVLTVTFTPANATNQQITWSSSDASIAAVDENGLVTGMEAGTVTITAIGAGNLTATCTVTVRKSTTLLTKEAKITSTTYQEVLDSFEEFVTNNTSDEAIYSLYEEPANGVLTVNEDGSFSYIPRNGQVGDSETFTVSVNAGTEYAFLKGTIELVETIDDSDSDTDTDSDSDADSDSDTGSDTDSDTDSDSISNTTGDSSSDTNSNTGEDSTADDTESDDADTEEVAGDTAESTKAANATKTGDNSNMGLWLLLLSAAVAAFGGAGYTFYKKK